MPILHLAWKSLLNRHLTAALTLFSIALSVTLLVGVERVRVDARESFANTPRCCLSPPLWWWSACPACSRHC